MKLNNKEELIPGQLYQITPTNHFNCITFFLPGEVNGIPKGKSEIIMYLNSTSGWHSVLFENSVYEVDPDITEFIKI